MVLEVGELFPKAVSFCVRHAIDHAHMYTLRARKPNFNLPSRVIGNPPPS